jgi:1-acyl-sn-glycerol-3-phosphate acyltransferase
MSTAETLLILAGVLVLLAMLWAIVATPRLQRFHGGDAGVGLAVAAARVHSRVMHRLRVEGLEHVEMVDADGPVLIVANHTGAIDPFLAQGPFPRLIHWMMARDMMGTGMDDVWNLLRVVPVDRTKADTAALRQTLRLLRNGQVVGIFPEGRITRPRGSIRPFMDGLGMLATRTGAQVVPVLIDGTPDTESIFWSLLGPSHSRLRVLEPMRFDRSTTPHEAAAEIRRVMLEASQWHAIDRPMDLHLGGT